MEMCREFNRAKAGATLEGFTHDQLPAEVPTEDIHQRVSTRTSTSYPYA